MGTSLDQSLCGPTKKLNMENVAHELMKMDGPFKENSKKIAEHDDALNRMANEMNEMKRDIRKLLNNPSLESKRS